MKRHTTPVIKSMLAIAVLLSLSACSTKVSYRFLDWAVAWSISDYVDWTSAQKKAFNIALDNTLDWHQSTQLPHYSNFFRELAQDVRLPITAPRVEKDIDQISKFWQDIMREITPKSARLLAQLDDQQANNILENIEEKNQKRSNKYARMTLKQRHSDRVKSTSKFVKRFIGTLTKEQKSLISLWAETAEDTQPEWAASRNNWLGSFQTALDSRTEPGFEQEIQHLFIHADSFWSSAYQKKYTDNKNHAVQLVISLHESLNKKQQKKLQQELIAWADNFSELSEEKMQLANALQ